ncbi:MAG TPA: methyltransferase domain-containing protein [Gemmatimonadales bacterium]
MAVLEQQVQQPADALNERVRATWTAGDFGRIAVSYEQGAAEFVVRLGLQAGERVLDAACGTGNLALPAARTGARVAAVDIAPALVAQLAARAAAEGLAVDARDGDVEALPFADRSFDTVISMFGAMFAAHPRRAAEELLRVTRPGGRIVMANWTPDSFIGQMLRTTVAHVPPPPGMPSVLLWGDEDVVRTRLGAVSSELRLVRRPMVLAFPVSPEETVRLFRIWYGPTVRAFAALEEERQDALFADLVRLWTEHNTAGPDATRVESDFLEVVAVRA